jgi:plasmid stabilization system protein ParE
VTTLVVITDEAERHLAELVAWWTENRPLAPSLVQREFAHCVQLLETAPMAGVRFLRTPVPGVRRLVMRRTRNLVYYIYDSTNSIAYVIAVWGAPKEHDPVLVEPKR